MRGLLVASSAKREIVENCTNVLNGNVLFCELGGGSKNDLVDFYTALS